jgi:hypothetical protein
MRQPLRTGMRGSASDISRNCNPHWDGCSGRTQYGVPSMCCRPFARPVGLLGGQAGHEVTTSFARVCANTLSTFCCTSSGASQNSREPPVGVHDLSDDLELPQASPKRTCAFRDDRDLVTRSSSYAPRLLGGNNVLPR